MHPEAPQFNLFGTGRFSGRSRQGYVRLSAKRAARGVRIAAHYQPAEAPPEAVPLEIEHAWYEDDPRVGRRERTHIERTDALTHHYIVRCAEEPHNERIALRIPSLQR